MIAVEWNGTTEEKAELLVAIQHNCACRFSKVGLRISSCIPHQMLLNDQRALNGLLWNRHLVQRLLAEEGIVDAGAHAALD